MTELLVRCGVSDLALLERVLTAPQEHARPNRVVLAAHVAAARPRFAEVTRQSGIPLLVDPQTFYWQDAQHGADAWAQLPFGEPELQRPSDLLSPARQSMLVAACIDFQLSCGATALIPPYVHIDRENDGWIEVQVGLWRRTRRYLDQQDLALPVVPVLAVGWRLLDRHTWHAGVDRLQRGLVDLEPAEIALAASRVDQGSQPDQRLVGLVSTIQQLRRQAPVLAWRQGVLGEAAVAAGAVGYETGIGWGERCDLRQAMAAHRRPRVMDSIGARPVYIAALRRSIPKRNLQALLGTRVGANLLCMDYQCCSTGPTSLLGDARAHALVSRGRTLNTLDRIDRHAWRWQHLADIATAGLDVADRINRIAASRPSVTKVDTAALHAMQLVANNRRQTLLRRSAA